jgi:hypothetical protein
MKPMSTKYEVALAAIHNRDPDALDAAFTTTEDAAQFRDEVLHTLEPEACLWFWRQSFDEAQFQSVAESVADVAAAIARKQGLQIGTDFSRSVDGEGLPQILCSELTYSRVAAELPVARRSVLRALVQVLPA